MPWALSEATGDNTLRQPCECGDFYGLHRRQRLQRKIARFNANRAVDNKPQYQDNFVTLANRAGFRDMVRFSNRGANRYDTATPVSPNAPMKRIS